MTPHERLPYLTDLQPGLEFSARSQDDYTVATLSGELDLASAPVLRERLLGVLGPHSCNLIVDLAGVTFCDASGLAVLLGTSRRAELLGGVLRLAAAATPVTAALRITGLDRRLEVFSTILAAIASPRSDQHGLDGKKVSSADLRAGRSGQAGTAWSPQASPNCPDPDAAELRAAVTGLLAHADAWRDADPNRRFTPAIQALASAQAGTDQVALTQAARSVLTALGVFPLTHSAVVATSASRLRRLFDSGARQPAPSRTGTAAGFLAGPLRAPVFQLTRHASPAPAGPPYPPAPYLSRHPRPSFS